jgi:hypothetical protein
MQATADRRICFWFTTSTLRRQAALMGRDAHWRGDLPLNASSAMSGVDRLRFDVYIDSLVVTSQGSCAPVVRDYRPQ